MRPKNSIESLEATKQIIPSPKYWTKGTLYRDKNGLVETIKQIQPNQPEPDKHWTQDNQYTYNNEQDSARIDPQGMTCCLEGAMIIADMIHVPRTPDGNPIPEAVETAKSIAEARGNLCMVCWDTQEMSVADFNDHASTTHQSVIKLIDETIKRTIANQDKWEWYIRDTADLINYDSGGVTAKNVTNAKRLATRASDTGHWNKRWTRRNGKYHKTLRDGQGKPTKILTLEKTAAYQG